MSNDWVDSASEALLNPRSDPVVPLLATFDASDFGRAAHAYFELLRPPALKAVQHAAHGTEEITAAVRRIRSAGFGSSIAPLQLIPNQPIWCCWFQDFSQGGFEQWNACRSALDEFKRHISWLLFLKIDKDVDPDTVVRGIEDGAASAVFLLGEQGELLREAGVLGQGSVCLMLAGWERYCSHGELDLRKALLLHGSGFGYILGVGSSGVDREYHAARWSRKIAQAVAERWRQPSGAIVKPQLPAAREIIRQLLPKHGYRVDAAVAGEPVRPGVVLGKVELELGWGGGDDFQPIRGLSNKDNMRHYLSVVDDTRAFLRLGVFPNTKRFIRQRAQSLLERSKQDVESRFTLPQAPEGLFAFLKHTLDSLRGSCRQLGQARVNGFAAGEAFASLFGEAKRRIDAVPNLAGALLRGVLIVVGLAWLLLGPMVWPGSEPDGAERVRQGVLVGALSLLCFLSVAVPTSYVFRVSRALRAMEATRSGMIAAHVWEVCRYLIEELHTVGASLERVLDDKESKVERIAEVFAGPWTATADVTANRRPIFDDDTVDPALAPKVGALATAAYQGLVKRLSAGTAQLDAEAWKTVLLEEASRCAEEALARTTLGEFVARADSTRTSHERIIKDVLGEARKPSLRMPETSVTPPALCFAPPSWQPALRDLINVELHMLPCPDLLAVSVRPLSPV